MPPKLSPFTFGNEPLNFGESVSVYCSINAGDYPILIEWFLNEVTMEKVELDNIHITDVGKRGKMLSIDAVNERYAGNYTCKASNLADSVQHTAELFVNGILN